ncbi:hypothetical protein [Mesorhizobium sp. DCY119]|uniref:hypothetical protein n=1 Tax=Mesorhizobium sp. DCY119 TaxID=2108445 RepID=UPI000E6BB7C1|nr:hypothetical protein [Mesorhizobium sp. DCY119]RJG46461.1 hypothetical protein D3Y55_20925 [Mesorhizobium sp. DCY119]
MKPPIRVTDHAVLRYLERAHGLDVEAVRNHLASRVTNGVRLGAIGVTIENVKLVIKRHADSVSVVTALKAGWRIDEDRP